MKVPRLFFVIACSVISVGITVLLFALEPTDFRRTMLTLPLCFGLGALFMLAITEDEKK